MPAVSLWKIRSATSAFASGCVDVEGFQREIAAHGAVVVTTEAVLADEGGVRLELGCHRVDGRGGGVGWFLGRRLGSQDRPGGGRRHHVHERCA